jgi:hypothetical protein
VTGTFVDTYGRELTFACRICGKQLRAMGRHATQMHGITAREYQRRFPGAPVTSENYRGIKAGQLHDRGLVRYWTRDRVIKAIQAWAHRTGAPPTYKEWTRSRQNGYRWRGKRRPSAFHVRKLFGSWNAAIEAAGLPARARHGGGRHRPATHCKRGHRLTPANRSANGRQCRICHRAVQRRWREKNREKILLRRRERYRQTGT